MDYFSDKEKIYINIFNHSHTDMHEHDFLEFVYILNGSARHFMNGRDIVINKGNYFIIDYNTYHGYEQIGKEPLSVMNCLFTPDFIDKTMKQCRKFSEVVENYLIHHSYKSMNANPANRIFFDEEGKVYDMLIKIYNEYEKKHVGYIEVMRCVLIELIIHTMREIQKENELVYSSAERYVMDFVNENYMEKITLGELAAELKYSLPYLSRIFRKSCGMTFENFLQKTRIEQSCRLLANTDKKIIDIAECVGYTDLKFFNMIFKRYMNMTPGKYRKLYR